MTGRVEANCSNALPNARVGIVLAAATGGGAENVARTLAKGLARAGAQVDLISLSSAKEPSNLPPEVRFLSLHSRRARWALLRLRSYVRATRPEIIISNAFHVNILTCLAILGFRKKPKIVLVVHSAFSQALNEYPWITRSWLRAATTTLYRFADAIVAVSKGVGVDLAKVCGFNPDRVTAIHNPVIGEDFERRAAEPAAHEWARNKRFPLIVAVGRLTKAKDFGTLLRAFARIQGLTNARLLILGEGEQRPALERLVAEIGVSRLVDMPGRVANPLPYVKAADLFVLSSKREGFGNVLVEAMATGTPVIATDCAHGPREILEDGKWGTLVGVGDDDALARAMIEILEKGGTDARARAVAFADDLIIARYIALLESLGKSGGRKP